MDIQLLKTFLEVRNTRHFGDAAKNLKITQAAVSSRIKLLETTLGSPLFNRYRNNLQLTEAGEKLVQYAELLLKVWEQACEETASIKDSGKSIRIGALNGFCGILLNKMLPRIFEAIPGIKLTVENYQEETVIKRLHDRNLDLVLLYHPSKSIDHVSRAISSVELCLVSTQSGQNLEQALKNNYISVEWGSFFNDRFMQQYISMPRAILNTTDAATALQFLLEMEGEGCAYLPHRLVESHLDSSLFRVEEAPIFHQPIYAIHSRLSALIPELDIVREIIAENAKPVFAEMDEVLNDELLTDLLIIADIKPGHDLAEDIEVIVQKQAY